MSVKSKDRSPFSLKKSYSAIVDSYDKNYQRDKKL